MNKTDQIAPEWQNEMCLCFQIIAQQLCIYRVPIKSLWYLGYQITRNDYMLELLNLLTKYKSWDFNNKIGCYENIVMLIRSSFLCSKMLAVKAMQFDYCKLMFCYD